MLTDSIFNGTIAQELQLPDTTFQYPFLRREWGIKTLGNYVASIHGVENRDMVHDNGNASGRLTGIKTVVRLGGKLITYALIEPKKNSEGKILISKSEVHEEEVIFTRCPDVGGKLESPLAAALKKANVNVASLPESAELVVLEVNQHPKTKKPALKPVKVKSDPLVGGKPSLRVFHVCNGDGSLAIGQRWQTRVKGAPVVTMGNKPGFIPVVHFNVDLLRVVAR